LVKVADDKVVEVFTTLIKPHETISFNPWNIGMHGIRPSEVLNAPEFRDIAIDIWQFAGGLPFVAHSAAFDVSVLTQTAALYSAEVPEFEFYCTKILARNEPSVDLLNYGLVNVCDFLDIEFEETHRAEADAMACAEVAIRLGSLQGAEDMAHLASKLLVTPGIVRDGVYGGSRSPRKSRAGNYPSTFTKAEARKYLESMSEEDFALDDDFEGKEVVFTGTLSSMDRRTAQELILRAGGIPGGSVTKKTSLVVVGAEYDAELRPGAQLSGKLKSVVDKRAKGAAIEVITESEFLELFEN
jgi:DNA polymerase-3 subunit epsilon